MISAQRMFIAGLSFLVLVTGCTVQPLHSTGGATAVAPIDIIIEPVDTRLEQQVRNRLIFLLNGGNAEPISARFNATLNVRARSLGLLKVQRSSSESDTTAISLSVTGTLVLTDTANDGDDKTFTRVARVSYDQTTQRFANSRARIDAEDRAAAELAEELRNLVLVYLKSQ
ncbi:MAG: LPS assembly lipoprotein LptE [Pseudomonadota bacterium]